MEIINEQDALISVQEQLIKKLELDIKKLNIKLLYLKETNIKQKPSLFENINCFY
tara:strand:- start:207 stop:371 length:165 start_codon:yes stop_codon:yes gene_type:complete